MWVAISDLPLGSADLGRDLKERGALAIDS